MIREDMQFPHWLGILALGLMLLGFTPVELQAQPHYKDAKSIMIVGRATGRADDYSKLSIQINGVDFIINPYAVAMNGMGQTAHQSCLEFQEQISGFRLGARPKAEFDASCIHLAGEAALLILQPSASEYPPPSQEDEEMAKWLKARQRLMHLRVSSTDDTQDLYIK